MIVTMPRLPRSNLTRLNTPCGATETELRNISGPEIARTEFTGVNPKLTAIVWAFHKNVIMTGQHQFN